MMVYYVCHTSGLSIGYMQVFIGRVRGIWKYAGSRGWATGLRRVGD